MDITVLFKACVKTVRMRNKALGVSSSEQDKSRILNSISKKKSVFGSKAKDIATQVCFFLNFGSVSDCSAFSLYIFLLFTNRFQDYGIFYWNIGKHILA